MAITRRHSSSEYSVSSWLGPVMPAELMSTSMRPNSWRICFTALSMDSCRVTSTMEARAPGRSLRCLVDRVTVDVPERDDIALGGETLANRVAEPSCAASDDCDARPRRRLPGTLFGHGFPPNLLVSDLPTAGAQRGPGLDQLRDRIRHNDFRDDRPLEAMAFEGGAGRCEVDVALSDLVVSPLPGGTV